MRSTHGSLALEEKLFIIVNFAKCGQEEGALVTTWSAMALATDSSRSQLRFLLGRLVLFQVGGTAAIALLAGLLVGWPMGRSVALGGLAVFLPAALSALRMGLGRSDTPQAALRTQVSAQTLKWLCTLCVFGGIFLLDKQVYALGVFLGFGAIHLAYWLALLLER